MIAERFLYYALQAEVKANVHTSATAAPRISCAPVPVYAMCNNSWATATSSTTEIYTHVEIQDLQQALESAANRP